MSGAELSDYHICVALNHLNCDACIGFREDVVQENLVQTEQTSIFLLQVRALPPLQLLRCYLMIRGEKFTSP